MVQINFALREVNCKIVYYGPGLSGKTTNIEVVHLKAPKSNKGELTSIATEGDRTLFFDYMPLDLGNIAGMRTKFQLYTVPGQVYYNSTRKLVLQGVDGIIFVADSQADKLEENLESLENLRNNLIEAGKDLDQLPMLIQFNKRDMPNALDVETLNRELNPRGVPTFEAVANTGEGVFPTLKALSSIVLENLSKQRSSASSRPITNSAETPVAAAAAAPVQAQAPAQQGAPSPSPQGAPMASAAPAEPPVEMVRPKLDSVVGGRPAPGETPVLESVESLAPPSQPGPSTEAERPAPAKPQAAKARRPQQQRAKPRKQSQQTKKKPAKRQVPRPGPAPAARHNKVQVQRVEIGGNSRGKLLTLITLGIVVFGALGFILYSFGVL